MEKGQGGGHEGVDLRSAPTPQRQRASGVQATSMAVASEEGTPWGSPRAGEVRLPAEARGLQWPQVFCAHPKGERLVILEDGALARRTNGVGFGTALVGPLSFDKGTAYFEVEIAELGPKGSQTMAIGFCSSLPVDSKVARAERARDIGQGSYLVGYDLPKVFVHGREVAKIGTKQWRPLKELAEGDVVGLLLERQSMELTVFVNGERKATAAVPTADASPSPQRWGEVWGVFDLHGMVRAARARGPASLAKPRRPQLHEAAAASSSLAAATAPAAPAALAGSFPGSSARLAAAAKVPATLAAAPLARTTWRSLDSTPLPAPRLASTQDLEAPTPVQQLSASQASVLTTAAMPGTPSLKRTASRVGMEVGKKRLRLGSHPCGCMVHLMRDTGETVHVPRMGDFVIGRNPKSCNLTLDSPEVPNMISRRHAVIVSADDAVMVVDCESVNGTFVNGRRVGRETLRQGDELVVGNPAQSPSAFRLSISMPPMPS